MLIMVPMSLLVNLTLQQDFMLNFFVFVKYLNAFLECHYLFIYYRIPLLQATKFWYGYKSKLHRYCYFWPYLQIEVLLHHNRN